MGDMAFEGRCFSYLRPLTFLFSISLGQTAGACGTAEEAPGSCAEDEGQGGEAGD